jgi:hypothetical protein
VSFSKLSLLKIRGERPARRTNSLAGEGVMEVTPFIPLILRGMGETLIFKRELVGKTELLPPYLIRCWKS